MKITLRQHQHGIALVIVMIVIVVLGILAGGFAYSMKVETRLAQNGTFDTELEWMGRSGVELARYVISQSASLPGEPWDSLNQRWAGGPKGTNEAIEMVSLERNELGRGTFSVKITDAERKLNVNVVNEAIMQQAMLVIGVDAAAASGITDAFMDWRDVDNQPRLGGAESEDYMANPNPGYTTYVAKNGPIDDIAELLLIHGVTPEIFWGAMGRDREREMFDPAGFRGGGGPDALGGGAGLVDLFTPISTGTININTASSAVLQLIPGVDPGLAQAIIMTRAGLDGVDGTEDDMPFRSPRDLSNVPGMVPQFVQGMQSFLAVRSMTFEVLVEARIGDYRRRYVALIRRNTNNPRDAQTLYFHWK